MAAPTQAAQPPAETQPTEQPTSPFSVGQGSPPQFVSPRPAPQAQSENDQLLFGPVGAQVGANVSSLGPVPPDIVGYLPVLARAASQPGAPPALTALLRVLVDKIDQTGY